MPTEHQGEIAFSYVWREITRNSENGVIFEECDSQEYTQGMLLITWSKIVHTFSTAFDTTEDPHLLQKIIVTLSHMAKLGSYLKIPHLEDTIIASLVRISGLVRPIIGNEMDHHDNERKIRVINPWNVYFGKYQRGQLAILLAFGILHDKSNMIHDGFAIVIIELNHIYIHINLNPKAIELIISLFSYNLLPESFLICDDLTSSMSCRILKLERSSTEVIRLNQSKRETAGLFSTLSNLLALAGSTIDEDQVPSQLDVESEIIAKKIISCCNIEMIFSQEMYVITHAVLIQ